MHCHSYYSNDSIASPEALFREAKKKGLDGIALTDHNTTKGWAEAEKAAGKTGMALIRGEEIKVKENGRTIGEILAYFINKEISPKNKTIEQIVNEIKLQGGVAIIAHPYHWRKSFKYLEKYKNMCDGLEAFNSRSQSAKGNINALAFALKNNLSMTAGSDCHSPNEAGLAYAEAVGVNSLGEFKNAILKGETKIYGKQSPFYVQLFATIGKVMHLFWQPK